MATNNQINLDLTTTTGTGSFAGTTSPTFVTPTIGVATADSINFGASGTDGIKGVTNGGNADAGYVGEFKSVSVLVGSKVGLTTGTYVDVATLSLTAGDWDVSANIAWEIDAGSTSSYQYGALNTVSVTPPTKAAANNVVINIDPITGANTAVGQIGVARYSLSGTTTIYLIANVTLGGGLGASGYGFIGARRVR